MSKEYGINLGYIPLEKEQYKEIKNTFLEDCSKQELYDTIDDPEWILEKFTSEELLNSILDSKDGDWIIDNLDSRNLEHAQNEFISNIEKLNKTQIAKITDSLEYYNEFKILPTDNLNDLAKAEFIIENWDRIKIENINL